MARTTETAVKDIMAPGKDYDGTSSLRPFVAVAGVIVSNYVAACTRFGKDVPASADLAVMEGWVAAWAYKNSDQQLQTSNAGRSSASFRGVSGKGLESNLYGQTAKMMDPHGILAAVAEGRVATGTWLGRPPSEQTNYSERN